MIFSLLIFCWLWNFRSGKPRPYIFNKFTLIFLLYVFYFHLSFLRVYNNLSHSTGFPFVSSSFLSYIFFLPSPKRVHNHQQHFEIHIAIFTRRWDARKSGENINTLLSKPGINNKYIEKNQFSIDFFISSIFFPFSTIFARYTTRKEYKTFHVFFSSCLSLSLVLIWKRDFSFLLCLKVWVR